jgi:hypothetical protein
VPNKSEAVSATQRFVPEDRLKIPLDYASLISSLLAIRKAAATSPAKRSLRLASLLALVLATLGVAPSARAWGCEGHQIIALIAEAHLNPRARSMAFQILSAGPISQNLPRFCGKSGFDPLVDSSTWADDVRSLRPETAAWHFINIPRGARHGRLARYCPSADGCLTSALAAELRILRSPRTGAQARADALRFVIHLVGDLHQPMHAVTNNDRGGNCVPIAFFGRSPQLVNPQREDYSPNLHAVWDAEVLERASRGKTLQRLARELDRKFHARMAAWESQRPDFAAWAWETHALADTIAYGRLPRPIPIETPRKVATCADNKHISSRMLRLHEKLGRHYQTAAAPVVEEQLTKAGIRLATLLNSLWP